MLLSVPASLLLLLQIVHEAELLGVVDLQVDDPIHVVAHHLQGLLVK